MPKALILLIDPSAVTRAMYADCLRHHGYDVVEGADAAEGLRLFARLDPDLVVTELSDEAAWLDAIRMLRALVPGQRTPVIVCSTRINAFCPVPPEGIDADVVLAKPMSPRQLVRVAGYLLVRHGYPSLLYVLRRQQRWYQRVLKLSALAGASLKWPRVTPSTLVRTRLPNTCPR